MPVYFVYMLKASAGLSAIYLFYIAFFKGMTYYNGNRYFLLVFSMLACVMPFINVNVFVELKQLNSIAFLNHLPTLPSIETTENNTSIFPVSSVLFIAFIIGLFVMIIRLFVQLLSLWKMHLQATLLQDGQIKLYNLTEPIVPFSYFNNVYINKDNYSQNELDEIVKHELVHVQQKHTIDMLIIEVICILNWYNPFVWLLKKAVKENLEFIADDAVLKQGADKKNYQYLLLKVTGEVSFSIANNLNFSSLKNRILMMNKTKTNKLHLLKFAFVVPATCMLLLAFRNKREVATIHKKEYSSAKKYVLSSLTYSIQDKKVEAIVEKEQQQSLLKTGQSMNLDLDVFLHEHDRLKNLLEKNGYNLEKDGYNNKGKYGILFMIDTTLGNNSFSVQVNINLKRDELTTGKDETSDGNISTPIDNTANTNNASTQKSTDGIAASGSANEEKYSTKNTATKNMILAHK